MALNKMFVNMRLWRDRSNQMNAASRLLEVIKDLSEPVLAEVVDFAEFLRDKQRHAQTTANDESLLSLAGGLEHSKCFTGDLVALQTRMRDEWN